MVLYKSYSGVSVFPLIFVILYVVYNLFPRKHSSFMFLSALNYFMFCFSIVMCNFVNEKFTANRGTTQYNIIFATLSFPQPEVAPHNLNIGGND